MPLVTAANTVEGARFGGEEAGKRLKFLDATPDLSHVIFESSEKLTPEAAPQEFPYNDLYEWAGGAIRLVSDAHNIVRLGYEDSNVRHALSTDGDRVVWTEHEAGHAEQLMIRDMTKGETERIDVRQAGVPVEEGQPVFQTASSDGGRVFFTDDEPLTSVSRANVGEGERAEDLYVFEAPRGGPLGAGRLKDLTVPLNPGETAGVQGGVLGSSEGGAYVYFVANGVLAKGASPGDCISGGRTSTPEATCNLYVDHYDEAAGVWESPGFIATLSNADEDSWAGGAEFRAHGEVGLAADISQSGEYLAFMSGQELTGYDNRDAVSGARDQEVFLYHAEASATGQLTCVSCNSTGGRPVGVHESRSEPPFLLVDSSGMFAGEWLAGSITGWTSEGLKVAPLYQSRYLSDEGRLFFDSADDLVPADHNGVEDVYEYEPTGTGRQGHVCGPGSESSSEVFSASAAGCVGLISSGTSSLESVFLDASVDGTDVFLLTAAQLTSSDVDSAYDVYDAHECSVGAPCETPAAPEHACGSVDACRGSLGGTALGLESPSSMSTAGAGNVEPVTPVKKGVTESKAQRLSKALAGCRRQSRKRRAACERRARKLYGPAARLASHPRPLLGERGKGQ